MGVKANLLSKGKTEIYYLWNIFTKFLIIKLLQTEQKYMDYT